MAKTAEILIPTDLNEISLGQYQRISEVLLKEDYKKADQERELFSIVTDVPVELVDNVLGNTVSDTVNKILALLQTRDEYPIHNRFIMDGIDFGLIPDMEGSMTFGEYTNLDEFMKDPIKDMHLIMSILFRPIIDHDTKRNRYKIEDYITVKTYGEKMKQMPLSVALGGYYFLVELGRELLSAIPSCLEDQIATQETQALPNSSDTDGDGIKATLASLKEILEDSEILKDLMLMKPLPILSLR